jgi:HNH endonuclease
MRQREQRRGSSFARGYDAKHRKLRIQCFLRDGWKCVDCGWEPDVVKQARELGIDEPPTDVILEELRKRWHTNSTHLHGDHDTPIQANPDQRLDVDNYQTRCNECHSAKTMRENNGV